MYIKVAVQAGAKKESFVKKSKDHFRISVKEKARRHKKIHFRTSLWYDAFDCSAPCIF